MKEYCPYPSPIGTLLLFGQDGLLEELHFANSSRHREDLSGYHLNEQCFKEVIQQLDEYFEGKRKTFELAIAPQGTSFQKNVWLELQKIPYGATASYSEIALRLGNKNGCRAVGMANGKNPIPIIVPCHRIIGKDGSLTGFGGGLEVKKQLLKLEKEGGFGI